jgi:hypothetical protein
VISSTVISLLPMLHYVFRLIIIHICKFAFHLALNSRLVLSLFLFYISSRGKQYHPLTLCLEILSVTCAVTLP